MDRLIPDLICPQCRQPALEDERERFRCGSCLAAFPVIDGIPILIDDNTSVFSVAGVLKDADPQPLSLTIAAARRLVLNITKNYAAHENLSHLIELLPKASQPARVLVVGCGEGGEGTNVLDRSDVELVSSDISPTSRTDLCADAHRLPFADGSFDAVIVQAVLEHVLDPGMCVAEIGRVLRPAGLVYAETPFMQQVHLGAYDFTRFSHAGHRRLFRAFDELRSGAAVGPGSALAWSFVYFCVSFSTGRNSRRFLNLVSRYAVFWLKYLDRYLVKRDAALDAASGTYFLGRKRAGTTIPDVDIVAGYRGGM